MFLPKSGKFSRRLKGGKNVNVAAGDGSSALPLENPNLPKTGGHNDDTNLVVQHINLPKELRPLPCSRIFFWGFFWVLRAVFG